MWWAFMIVEPTAMAAPYPRQGDVLGDCTSGAVTELPARDAPDGQLWVAESPDGTLILDGAAVLVLNRAGQPVGTWQVLDGKHDGLTPKAAYRTDTGWLLYTGPPLSREAPGEVSETVVFRLDERGTFVSQATETLNSGIVYTPHGEKKAFRVIPGVRDAAGTIETIPLVAGVEPESFSVTASHPGPAYVRPGDRLLAQLSPFTVWDDGVSVTLPVASPYLVPTDTGFAFWDTKRGWRSPSGKAPENVSAPFRVTTESHGDGFDRVWPQERAFTTSDAVTVRRSAIGWDGEGFVFVWRKVDVGGRLFHQKVVCVPREPAPAIRTARLLVPPNDPRLPAPRPVPRTDLTADVRCRMRPLIDGDAIVALAPSPDCPPELVVAAANLHRGVAWPDEEVGRTITLARLGGGEHRFDRVPLEPPVWDVAFDGPSTDVVRYGWRADVPDAAIREPVLAPDRESVAGMSLLVVVDEKGVPAGITRVDLAPPPWNAVEDGAWLVTPWKVTQERGALVATGPRDPVQVASWRWAPTGEVERLWVGAPLPTSPAAPMPVHPERTRDGARDVGSSETSALFEAHQVLVGLDGSVDVIPASMSTANTMIDASPETPWPVVREALKRFPEARFRARLDIPSSSGWEGRPDELYAVSTGFWVATPDHLDLKQRVGLHRGPNGVQWIGDDGVRLDLPSSGGRPNRLLLPDDSLTWGQVVQGIARLSGFLVLDPAPPGRPPLVEPPPPPPRAAPESEGPIDPPPGALTLKVRVDPDYPKKASKRAGDQACAATVTIDAEGVPQAVEVSGCEAVFQAAAVDALMKWRWYPYKQDGVKVAVVTKIRVAFKAP